MTAYSFGWPPAEGAACQPNDRCVDGTRCHLLEPMRSYCAKPCALQSDCFEGLECRLGLSSWTACVAKLPPPVTPEPVAPAPLPAAPAGCSTSGALLSLSLAVLLARRRR